MKTHFFRTLIGSLVFCSSLQSQAFFDSPGGISFGALPIGWMEGDISTAMINKAKTDSSTTPQILFSPDVAAEGYREVHTDSLTLKLGLYTGWYRYMGSYASTLFGAGVAIIPVIGSSVTSDRYVANKQDAENRPRHRLPENYLALRSWYPNDSVLYYSKGGIIFSVGVGYAFTGLSGDYYAAGEWTTFVEKLDNNRVFVKLTNVKLTSLDAMLGNFVANVLWSNFKKLDNMFAYNFDLSDPRAQIAYDAMIHGSLKEAQVLNSVDPEAAIHVLSETGGKTAGKETKLFLGIPFLNVSHDSGNLLNDSKTILNQGNTLSDVEYGLFWSVDQSQWWTHHKNSAQNFYSISYVTQETGAKNPEESNQTNLTPTNYGVFSLSYEKDHSKPDTIDQMMKKMIAQTGMREQLKYELAKEVSNRIAGYVHLSLNVVLSEPFTQYLLEHANDFTAKTINTDEVIDTYFTQLKDPEKLCESDFSFQDCKGNLKVETKKAVNSMLRLLVKMSKENQQGNRKRLVQDYAKFGKEMFTNEFTFNFVGQLAHSYPLMITFKAEGEKISKVEKTIHFE